MVSKTMDKMKRIEMGGDCEMSENEVIPDIMPFALESK